MKKHPTVFVDLDGVTADFDSHYEDLIGPLPPRNKNNRDVDWSAINAIDFFLTMPPMDDAPILWSYLNTLPNRKVVLTGVPSTGAERAASNKREWVKRQSFIPASVEVKVTRSKEKFMHCAHGDILIDDWIKYQGLWEAAGGIWITHTSAADTIQQLKNHFARRVLAL